jgi:hypothetical protein
MRGASWPLETYWSNARVSPLAASGSGQDRAPLLMRSEDQVVPAFPLAVMGKWLGAYWPHCEARPGTDIVLRGYQNQLLARIPIDETGALRLMPVRRLPDVPRIEFYTAILSAEQMHNGQVPLYDLNKLRHGLVLATVEHPDAATTAPVPEGRAYPGSLAARALTQMLLREYWEPSPAWASALMITLASILMAWVGSLHRLAHTLLGLLGGVLFALADSWFFLRFFDVLLPCGPALVAGVAAWGASLALPEFQRLLLPATPAAVQTPSTVPPPAAPAS